MVAPGGGVVAAVQVDVIVAQSREPLDVFKPARLVPLDPFVIARKISGRQVSLQGQAPRPLTWRGMSDPPVR